MLGRGLIGVALVIAGVLITAAPAAAIPPGNNLIVIAYYSDSAKTQVIGQSWSGCGQPAGSWGVTSNIRNLFFTPC
jgi:hypothetical protein